MGGFENLEKIPLNPPFPKGEVNTCCPTTKELKQFSQELRKNMTDAELLVWSRIRGNQLRGDRFYRQKIIVDFYCARAKLVTELDGGQHYTEEGREKDRVRDCFLEDAGVRVIRFSDRDVFENLQGVLEKIWSCS